MTVQQFRYQDIHTQTGRSYYTVKKGQYIAKDTGTGPLRRGIS